jgi:hypothetical protein
MGVVLGGEVAKKPIGWTRCDLSTASVGPIHPEQESRKRHIPCCSRHECDRIRRGRPTTTEPADSYTISTLLFRNQAVRWVGEVCEGHAGNVFRPNLYPTDTAAR